MNEYVAKFSSKDRAESSMEKWQKELRARYVLGEEERQLARQAVGVAKEILDKKFEFGSIDFGIIPVRLIAGRDIVENSSFFLSRHKTAPIGYVYYNFHLNQPGEADESHLQLTIGPEYFKIFEEENLGNENYKRTRWNILPKKEDLIFFKCLTELAKKLPPTSILEDR